MNMPDVWTDFLRAAGHQAVHWSTIGDIRAEDTLIMEWARHQDHVVLTHALDFGALLYLTNAAAPNVIQLRAEHIVPAAVGEAVLEAIASCELMLRAGALVTIDPRRHRVRLLPLKGTAGD